MLPLDRQPPSGACCLYATPKDRERGFGICPRQIPVNDPCGHTVAYRKHVSGQRIRDNLARAMIPERLWMCVSAIVASVRKHYSIGQTDGTCHKVLIAESICERESGRETHRKDRGHPLRP
jgi:hypothetical protein